MSTTPPHHHPKSSSPSPLAHHRINKLWLYFRTRELMVHINIRHIAFCKFTVLVFGVAHWVGCVFYFLARLSDFAAAPAAETWLEQFYTASPK